MLDERYFIMEFIDFVESRNLIMGGSAAADVFSAFISSFEHYGSASEENAKHLSMAYLSENLSEMYLLMD